TTLAFDSQGQELAASGEAGITLCQLDAHRQPLTPARHLSVSNVSALSFDQAGAGLVARTSSGALRWDLRHPNRPPSMVPAASAPLLTGHIRTPTAISIDHLHGLLAAGDGSGRVALWRASNGNWRFVRSFSGEGDRIVAVVFDATGEHLAAGSRDGTVAFWAVGAGDRVLRGASVTPVVDGRLALVT